MSPTIIMSPITFKRQVEQLVTELGRSIQLCQDIRTNRNISAHPENLDRLQSTLECAEESIPLAYNTTRRLAGTQFEIGDEKSRMDMDRYIVDLQTKVKPRLHKIAYPAPKLRHKHEREQPGFRDMLNQWKGIYQEFSQTLLSLSRRVSTGGIPIPAHHPNEPTVRITTPTPRKTGEITISLKEFDHLLQHMKNSWEETLVGGRYLYVNVHDKSTRQWDDLPANAYVKSLPGSPRLRRSPSYERRSPKVRFSHFE